MRRREESREKTSSPFSVVDGVRNDSAASVCRRRPIRYRCSALTDAIPCQKAKVRSESTIPKEVLFQKSELRSLVLFGSSITLSVKANTEQHEYLTHTTDPEKYLSTCSKTKQDKRDNLRTEEAKNDKDNPSCSSSIQFMTPLAAFQASFVMYPC